MTPTGKNHHREARLRRRYRRAAIIGLALLAIGTLIVFTKRNPLAHPYQVRADFASAAELSKGSQVRIAGIQVGQVTGFGEGPGGTALVTMSIGGSGLPLHDDATFTVKPRLILEGNAYIDLAPGTPEAPDLRSGTTIPLSHTAITPQLDQLLDVFDTPARDALTSSIGQLAAGFGSGGGGSGAASAPGYASLRAAVRQLDGALPPVAEVAHALGGTEPDDLGHAISFSSAVTSQLAQSPAALADLVTSYNRVVGTLAGEDAPLAQSVSDFDAVLKIAPQPLQQIDAALPPLTRFATTLRPALESAPRTLTDTNRLLSQIRRTVAPGALPALLDDVSPVLHQLRPLEQRLGTLFSYSNPVTSCIATHVVPVLDSKLQDGANTTGDPVYLDMVHAFTGLTSFSSAVDGNGGTVRLGITTGDRIVDTIFPGLGRVVGAIPNVDGVRPTWLGFGVDPPFRPDAPCASQPLPDLNTSAAIGAVPQWASLGGTRSSASVLASLVRRRAGGGAVRPDRARGVRRAHHAPPRPRAVGVTPTTASTTIATTPGTTTTTASPLSGLGHLLGGSRTTTTTTTTTTPTATTPNPVAPLVTILRHLL